MSAHTSMKNSNELTFSTLAEMIKVTIGGESDNDLESVGGPKDISQANGSPQREWECLLCSKKLKSNWSLKRHMKLHSTITTTTIDNSQKDTVPKLLDISSATVPKNTIHFENETASKSDNSYNDSSDSINHITQPDIKQNFEPMNVSENYGVLLPKGRIKGIIKSPTSPCKFCNKVLTSVYMKKHILKQHPEIVKKTDNSSSDINTDVNVSSPSQADSGNIASLSSLLEQDIDSSTCLSVSDALKRNNPYTVTETYSDDKLTEETDIKFNFNVLEFSKDTKIQSTPLVSEEKTSANLIDTQPSSITKLDEENINCNAPNNDIIKPINKQHHCPLCTKSYTTTSGLNRHLKGVHKVIQQRKCMVTNSLGSVGSMKNVNENQLPCKYFNKSSNSNEEGIQIPNNETIQQHSEEHPIQSISTSGIAKGLDHNAREKSKVFYHNPHRTLLRTVLQSNFISKQRKDYKEISDTCDAPFDNGRANSCDTSGEDKEQLGEHLKNISYSPDKNNYNCLEGGTLGHEFKSSTKNCTSVPFNSSSNIHSIVNSTAHSSLSSQIEISHKELNKIDNKVIQIKCTPPTDTQNLSVQSNEISPISDIISNISKCQFGGASNIDKREYFEDNSLKLVIPENDNNSSLSSKNDENILQPDKPRLIQNDKLVQQKEGNISEESDLSSGKLNNLTADDHSSEEKIHENDSPALASSPCKLNNSDTKYGYGDQNLVDSVSVHLQKVNYQKFPELKEISISEESDVSFRNLNDSAVNSEEEILGESSCDVDSSVQDYADKSNRCRLCHQYLSSLDILSQHLKDIHDIPVLKKHILHPSSSELSHCFREPGKLSPPKLKLGTNESDSESVSGYDNRCSSSKMTSCSSELETAQKESFTEHALQNLCTLVSPLLQQGDHDDETILQNSQSKLKKHFVHLELDKTEVELDQSGLVTLQPSNCQHSKPEYLLTTAFSASSSKWTSLCDIYSNFNKDLNPLFKSTKYLFLDSKNLSLKGTRQKCTSLPNIKLLDYQTPDYNEMKHNNFESNYLKKIHNQKFPELDEISLNISEENKHSIEENTTLSSVTDNTEICKSSCDSLSAQNFPVKIKIKSPHSLNPILSSNISHHKSARHKKKYRRKLISKFRSRSLREKKIKRTSRGGYFPYCKKFKTNKTLKLSVTTLKAATEISEFLKTHKQPTVELERLKEEQESNCMLDKKCNPVSNVNCGRYNIKEAVVKLERVQFPNNLHKVVNIKQELCIPNSLDSNININSVSSQNPNSQIDGYANDFYLDSSNADISHSENSLTQDISPKDSIALSLMDELDSNTVSSDSVQYLGTVQSETNYTNKASEFCSSALKKCFVVLNRISV